MNFLEISGAYFIGVTIGNAIFLLLRIPVVRATIFSALMTTGIVGAIHIHPFMMKAVEELGLSDGPAPFLLWAIRVCLVLLLVLLCAINILKILRMHD